MNKESALYICLDLICRERQTQYTLLKKPDLVQVWKNVQVAFKNRQKMPINSWAGDLFAKCANEFGLGAEYETLRDKQFSGEYDDGAKN